MKLLFIIHGIDGGGAEKQMANLLRHFSSQGHEVHLALCNKASASSLLAGNIVIHELSSKKPASLFMLLAVIKLIRGYKPDKVISFLWSINIITIAASMLCGTLKKTIVSERIIPSLHTNHFRFGFIWQMLIALLYPLSSRVIAVSKQVKDDLLQNFSIGESKIFVIPNGIDISLTATKAAEIVAYPIKKPYILYTGNLFKYKNHLFLLEAFKKATEQLNDIRLVLIGEGEERSRIEEYISKNGLSARVILLGKIPNPYPYLASAEAFVIASKYEGFSNAILEAAACKVPVIAVKNKTGVEEILVNNSSGFILEEEDSSLFAKKVIELISNTDLRNTFVNNAFDSLEQNFTLESMLKKYERVILA